jgi:hypothetical protein
MVDPIVPSPQTLDLIYGLEAKGLLHRSDDAKAGPRWSLTPDGDTTLRHALHKIEDINDLIAAALPADQRRRFVTDLQSILEACAELHEP